MQSCQEAYASTLINSWPKHNSQSERGGFLSCPLSCSIMCAQRGNLLIGLLKLFLFSQVAVHIFKNSAFRNPFIPAAKQTTTSINRKKVQVDIIWAKLTMGTNRKLSCSLFVPSAVMNEVFNLLILYADLYTLKNRKHTHICLNTGSYLLAINMNECKTYGKIVQKPTFAS